MEATSQSCCSGHKLESFIDLDTQPLLKFLIVEDRAQGKVLNNKEINSRKVEEINSECVFHFIKFTYCLQA